MTRREAAAALAVAALAACATAGLSGARPEPARGAGSPATARTAGFVDVLEVDPSIAVELRYFGSHNFMGRPVAGYQVERCLLTRPAAAALAEVQKDLRPYGLSLKVYDCYRPQRAVDSFIAWARDPADARMQGEFYPRVPKSRVFAEGYLAERSGHSRGSTVDLTVVPAAAPQGEGWSDGSALRDCALPADRRFRDGSLDFGTGWDCFDPLSALESPAVPLEARVRRLMLRAVMERRGFKPVAEEWWHFTLIGEPYPDTYFDFEIE